MFCREHVAQLRGIVDEIRARGAELVVVGSGTPSQAAKFRDAQGLTFPLLTDPGLRTFRAAGLHRSMSSTFTAGTVKNAWRSLRGGFRQGRVQGDPWQQGGTFVIAPDGKVALAHISRTGGDNAAPDEVLRALDAVAAPAGV